MMLGKRKREVTVVRRSLQNESALDDHISQPQSDAHEVFQHYFEAHFEPLAELGLPTRSRDEQEEDDDGRKDDSGGESETSEWDGISDAETASGAIEVVKHMPVTGSNDASVDHMEVKSFMSTKPPTGKASLATVQSQAQTRDDDVEVTNLKNDLDLQRLLQESSLRKQQQEASSRIDRHRTTDLRLQALGLRSSLYSQEKMPMAHRRGIKAKAHSRQELRRKDARENGIILEKASQKGSSDKPKRERGVDAPGVGKFRGGTLKLSRRDVADIQGPKQNTREGRRR